MRKPRTVADPSIIVAAVAFVSATIPHVVGWIRNRGKDDAETKHTLVDAATDLVTKLQEQQEIDHNHIRRLEILVDNQAVVIAKLRGRIARMEAAFYKQGQNPPNGHDQSDPDNTDVVWGDYPPIDAVSSEKSPET